MPSHYTTFCNNYIYSTYYPPSIPQLPVNTCHSLSHSHQPPNEAPISHPPPLPNLYATPNYLHLHKLILQAHKHRQAVEKKHKKCSATPSPAPTPTRPPPLHKHKHKLVLHHPKHKPAPRPHKPNHAPRPPSPALPHHSPNPFHRPFPSRRLSNRPAADKIKVALL